MFWFNWQSSGDTNGDIPNGELSEFLESVQLIFKRLALVRVISIDRAGEDGEAFLRLVCLLYQRVK